MEARDFSRVRLHEKGEYYDQSINATIYKKEGEEIMKILRGEEK